MQKLYDYNGDLLEITDATLSEEGVPADAKAVGEALIQFSPEAFGAVGDGVNDDTTAFQAALNRGGFVRCGYRRVYKITAPLRVKADTTVDLNSSTIQCSDKHVFFNFVDGDSYSGYNGNGNITIKNGTIYGGCISFIHGANITLDGVSMLNTLNDHFMEICACKNYVVRNCVFSGMQNLSGAALEYINIDTNATYSAFPHNKAGQNDPVFYDGSTSEDITVDGCLFLPGADTFAYGYDAVGAHSRGTAGTYTKNVTIRNNRIKGFSGYGVRINAMKLATVTGNVFEYCANVADVGTFDSDFVSIVGNIFRRTSGSGTVIVGSGGCPNLGEDYNANYVYPAI